MGQIKQDEHNALRVWAVSQGMQDPADLVIRQDYALVFRSATSAKAYRRMEVQYKEYLKDQKKLRMKKDAMQKRA
jgi:hypothetical protein